MRIKIKMIELIISKSIMSKFSLYGAEFSFVFESRAFLSFYIGKRQAKEENIKKVGV